MSSIDEMTAQLTGPGGAFEIETTNDPGYPMKRYKGRLPHLRSIVEIFGVAHGDKDFIVQGDMRLTYAEFIAISNRVSAGLTAAGVEKGDRVAVLSANNPEWCQTFWATVNLGGILTGLNGWWNADECIYGLNLAGPRVLVVDEKRLERIEGELHLAPSVEKVFLIDGDPTNHKLSGDAELHEFGELASAGGDAPGFPQVEIDEADPAVILFTSGTTGRPKGAVSTHANMIANVQNTVFSMMLRQTDPPADDEPVNAAPTEIVSLLTSPLFHVSGCHSTLVVGFMGGMKLVLPVGKFTPEKAFEVIEKEGVSIWATVPTLIWRACESESRHDYDLSSVQTVAFGGSPSADELQRRIRETFPNVRATSNAYGLTESSSVATILSAGGGPVESVDRVDSVGKAMPVVDIAIGDPLGKHLPAGATGEVLIRGPIIMAGYWDNPEATANTIQDGWLHTGDVGHLDDEGYLYITDRAKDMLIRGGENVYCVEIENRLVEHPEIADAAVVGVPHPELGEEVKAVLELVDGSDLSDGEIQKWVGETLAPFKVPTHIERWEGKLPRNASGKLLKNVLRGEGHVSFAQTM
jgi:long-chain acyl-CoA synthetase